MGSRDYLYDIISPLKIAKRYHQLLIGYMSMTILWMEKKQKYNFV